MVAGTLRPNDLAVGADSSEDDLAGGPGDTIEWGARMAAGVMVIVPSLLFFLLASGRIARGLAAGAVKG